jgi:hypothetical protein
MGRQGKMDISLGRLLSEFGGKFDQGDRVLCLLGQNILSACWGLLKVEYFGRTK